MLYHVLSWFIYRCGNDTPKVAHIREQWWLIKVDLGVPMGALWYPDDRSKPFIPGKFNKDLIATSRPADG